MATRPLITLLVAAILASLAASPVAAVSSGTPGPILFSRYSGELQDDYLYTVIPGSEPSIVPNTAGTFGGRWSPDGQVIAFDVWEDGLYLINADGSGKRLIVTRHEDEALGGPVWSPDGTKLAYTVNRPAGLALGDIEIYDPVAGTTETHDIELDGIWEWTDEYMLGFVWRDYDQIMNKNQELARWVFDEPGGDPAEGHLEFLTDSHVQDGIPRLSPDGSTIAWSVANLGWLNGDPVGDGQFSIWLMNADGSNQRKLIDRDGQVSWHAWSPDGTEVVHGPTITAVNVSTGATRPIEFGWGIPGDGFDWAPLPGTTDDFPIEGVRALAHPDGSAVATASASATSFKPTLAGSARQPFTEATAIARSVTIRQRLGEPARATLNIFKPSGVLLRAVDHGLKTGSVSYTWNGRLPTGRLAPAGTYRFVAKAVDLAGNVKKKTLYVKVVR